MMTCNSLLCICLLIVLLPIVLICGATPHAPSPIYAWGSPLKLNGWNGTPYPYVGTTVNLFQNEIPTVNEIFSFNVAFNGSISLPKSADPADGLLCLDSQFLNPIVYWTGTTVGVSGTPMDCLQTVCPGQGCCLPAAQGFDAVQALCNTITSCVFVDYPTSSSDLTFHLTQPPQIPNPNFGSRSKYTRQYLAILQPCEAFTVALADNPNSGSLASSGINTVQVPNPNQVWDWSNISGQIQQYQNGLLYCLDSGYSPQFGAQVGLGPCPTLGLSQRTTFTYKQSSMSEPLPEH